MKVVNTSKFQLCEVFPILGEVKIEPMSIKDIPDEIANVWLDPHRQTVCIKPYEEGDELLINDVKDDITDYENISYKQLKALAKERGLAYAFNITKPDLIAMLRKHDIQNTPQPVVEEVINNEELIPIE